MSGAASPRSLDVVDGAGETTRLYSRLDQLVLPLASPVNASLLFALLHVLLFWLPSLALHRRTILIKL